MRSTGLGGNGKSGGMLSETEAGRGVGGETGGVKQRHKG